MPDLTPGQPNRWPSIDFWRGYMLVTIFVNHVPGNAFEPLTQKNFGFSDSAEGFVFLSGLSLALAYGRRCAAGEWASVTKSLVRRSAGLYGVHVLLSLLGLAIFLAGAVVFDTGSLLQMHGRDLAVEAPGTMLLGVLSLGHQFGYFNILPMYILMIVMAPAFLWFGRASPAPLLGVSILIYLLAVTRGWNLPTWPVSGTWFFDPFAWQFMMAAGMAIGLTVRRVAVPRLISLAIVAGLIVGFGVFSVTNGFSLVPGFEDATRRWAGLDKTTLGFGRLLHFFSIAYLAYMLRVTDWLRRLPVFGPLSAIGRHSLMMFALLSLMAAAGQVLMQHLGHRPLTDIMMMVAGVLALHGAATLLDRRRARAAIARPNLAARPVSSRGRDLALGSAGTELRPASNGAC